MAKVTPMAASNTATNSDTSKRGASRKGKPRGDSELGLYVKAYDASGLPMDVARLDVLGVERDFKVIARTLSRPADVEKGKLVIVRIPVGKSKFGEENEAVGQAALSQAAE